MNNEDVSCSKCPNATHGFDRNASHNSGRYVCECESHSCHCETLIAERTAELEKEFNGASNLLDATQRQVEELEQQNAELTAELQSTRLQMSTDFGQYQEAHQKVKELTAEIERKMSAGEFLIQQNAELTAQRDAAMTLLAEARKTFEMWKDVAPAVSLCADIDAAIANCKEQK